MMASAVQSGTGRTGTARSLWLQPGFPGKPRASPNRQASGNARSIGREAGFLLRRTRSHSHSRRDFVTREPLRDRVLPLFSLSQLRRAQTRASFGWRKSCIDDSCDFRETLNLAQSHASRESTAFSKYFFSVLGCHCSFCKWFSCIYGRLEVVAWPELFSRLFFGSFIFHGSTRGDELVPARVSLFRVFGRGPGYRQREAAGLARATFFFVVARLLMLIPFRLKCAQAT